jgi:hypothetical protein
MRSLVERLVTIPVSRRARKAWQMLSLGLCLASCENNTPDFAAGNSATAPSDVLEAADAAAQTQAVPDNMAPPGAPLLCRPGEYIIFECSLAKRRIAVCGLKTSRGQRVAEFREGQPGSFSSHPIEGGGPLKLGRAFKGHSGGGETQISFSKGDRLYVVQSSSSSGYDEDERRQARFEAGLRILRQNKLVSEDSCVESPDPQPDVINGADGQIDLETASSFIPEGRFVDP